MREGVGQLSYRVGQSRCPLKLSQDSGKQSDKGNAWSTHSTVQQLGGKTQRDVSQVKGIQNKWSARCISCNNGACCEVDLLAWLTVPSSSKADGVPPDLLPAPSILKEVPCCSGYSISK